MKKILVIVLTIALPLFVSSELVSARQGCCSHHGGVCGCGCCDGSPLSAKCAPYYPECNGGYRPPPPPPCLRPDVLQSSASWRFIENRDDCNHNVAVDWQAVAGATDYSLYISKSTRDEPDTISDAVSPSFVLTQVGSGKQYIHMKAKNSCGWSNSAYWTIDVPSVKPKISVKEIVNSEEERELVITSSCAKSISATNIGSVPVTKKSVVVKPKKDTEYIFTAKNGSEIAKTTIKVKYPLPTPTQTPSPTPIPTLTPSPAEGGSITRTLLRLLKFSP